ncbi:hypothetical protein [Patulibacter defluvii]|uniref:hypothetical protein n=1 Tax=Patulibacter defluvii TaxID=3095358 RepID=UPI002A74F695|nr:hypothetical protein [Patulibacter sp. DM4]
MSIATTLLAQADDGSPGYVTAAVIVVGLVLLVYLAIVAFRVRDAAGRLDALEQRLGGEATSAEPSEPAPEAVGR